MHTKDKLTDGSTRLVCRVLLAEDMPENQRLVSFYLKQAGATVFIADNGQIAFDLALEARDNEFPFDVILMDIEMPVLNGNEATKQLRKAGYTGPIIAITTHANVYDKQTSIDAGYDDFTTKPIDPNRLVDLVEYYSSKQKQKTQLENTTIN